MGCCFGCCFDCCITCRDNNCCNNCCNNCSVINWRLFLYKISWKIKNLTHSIVNEFFYDNLSIKTLILLFTTIRNNAIIYLE